MTQDVESPKAEVEKQFFLIDGELLNAVASFLGEQKYIQVAGLIEGLKQSRPVNVTDGDAEGNKKAPASKKK